MIIVRPYIQIWRGKLVLMILYVLLYLERRPSARITENTIRKLNRIKMLGKWLGTIDRIKREGINNLRNFFNIQGVPIKTSFTDF